MNCIIYVRLPIDDGIPQYGIFDTRLAASRNYAKKKGWNIVDQVFDVDDLSSRVTRAKAKNLRNALAKRADVDLLLVSVTDILTFTEFDAIKKIADEKGLELEILLSPRYKNHPAGLPPKPPLA